MPIVIHRADPQPKPSFEYDKIVAVIVFVVVGLWIVESVLNVLTLGSLLNVLPKELLSDADTAEINRATLLWLAKAFGFGAWFVLGAIAVRHSLKYGFWLLGTAGLALAAFNRFPDSEQTLMESSFALIAMGYCGWRLAGWFGPKTR